MEENTEKSKNKCQYCGIEVTKGKVMHERYCKQNPEVNKEKPREEKEQPKEPQQEQKPLVISDVQHIAIDEYDVLPWFEDADGNRKPEFYRFIGIHENIPCALVMHYSGKLVPCYLVQGFIGMFPKDYEFPEVKQEPQPEEKQPVIASDKPIISPIDEENFKKDIIPQPISQPIYAQERKKKHWGFNLFGKKEKTTETTNSSANLAKKIMDLQGS